LRRWSTAQIGASFAFARSRTAIPTSPSFSRTPDQKTARFLCTPTATAPVDRLAATTPRRSTDVPPALLAPRILTRSISFTSVLRSTPHPQRIARVVVTKYSSGSTVVPSDERLGVEARRRAASLERGPRRAAADRPFGGHQVSQPSMTAPCGSRQLPRARTRARLPIAVTKFSSGSRAVHGDDPLGIEARQQAASLEREPALRGGPDRYEALAKAAINGGPYRGRAREVGRDFLVESGGDSPTMRRTSKDRRE
jgi:hypothetical protein